MPLVLYVDKYNYDDWGKHMETEAPTFVQYMKDKYFDGIFFDHMYKVRLKS